MCLFMLAMLTKLSSPSAEMTVCPSGRSLCRQGFVRSENVSGESSLSAPASAVDVRS
eukprot:CAMPEP_0183342036 /NCGR_PEP_ID=MMETSP0164_2-20130417/8208_1 /TAXON_ID=221442 /ORGANISM="Coccolithus pelagicus ssp braarudi, Strain PLY182g" /LENGTH=56 /DNA_ID=CAMNT_0025512511 /DNA_START=609 /DNA_END=779 /DNA_ORIENTATION=+